MAEIKIRKNSKTRIEGLEISCYGSDMIMVNNISMNAPLPVTPKDPEEFWGEKTDEERLETILEYIQSSINVEESDMGAVNHLYQVISRIEEEIDES